MHSKMYIAVRDEVPDNMVPVLVAHAVINADDYFYNFDQTDADIETRRQYCEWRINSFRKVVIRVNDKEYRKIRDTLECFEGSENTVFNAEGSCLVVLPVMSGQEPNVLKFAKMWKPKEI
jgi:peptidyl-tRNA hydrolase